MAHLSASAEVVRQNLERIEGEIAAACARVGRSADEVTICAATKYVGPDGMEALRAAGLRVAGENRLQDMLGKQQLMREAFEWHFIGAIQSRKIAQIAPNVSTIHSLATTSARDKLAALDGPLPRVLVQVNIAGEASKQGVAPEQLGEFLAGCPFAVSGLMTMPPLAESPEDARPWFAALAQLAAEHGLEELSMGTSQDYVVAVEEGATLVRVGSVLFTPDGQ